MKKLLVCLLLAAPPAMAGDLELNLPIAKVGSGYGFDWQSSHKYSLGIEGVMSATQGEPP